ncbi:hypothetical protein [Aromatoleum petrolei]|uniref:Uncharacterized protein n=1 Tax=Aromatoleum petrolei TaxID=76116 RepID=A0ABX1MIH7_9RHOO|nr:hypothetical protein [Aromatoleum petrolei]NMF87757.1 hypothetical protein [Aromatoleum petrolei]QTQ38246.1 Uncharacterized protein ToN1_41420 [Aromatoleum petrolei]
MYKLISRAAALLAGIVLSAGAFAAAELPAQSTEQAGVTVKVVPRNITGAVWEFEVVLDTHVRALTDDLLQGAALVAANGAAVRPTGWQGDPPGGHHRKGVLQFKALDPRPAILELRIVRPDEQAPRAFRWPLN